MTALQKIAMGILITILRAPVPAHPNPAWRVYNLLPGPIGWLFVLAGLRALAGTAVRTQRPRLLAVLALVVSVPLWFPEVSHLLDPKYNPGVSRSWSWLAMLPAAVFAILLTHELGRVAATNKPRDPMPEMVFGALRVIFVVVAVLPAIVYGAPAPGLENTMEFVNLLSGVGLVIALFSYNKRSYYNKEAAASMKETAASK